MIMKDNLTSKSIKCCEECYSATSRVTPLLNPEQCLKNHTNIYVEHVVVAFA